MNRIVALLIVALLSISFAFGQFVLSPGYPSGGTIYFGTGAYGNQGSTRSGSAGGAPASVGGSISYYWTWAGSGSAPAYAILTVTASATWGGQGGSADDGL